MANKDQSRGFEPHGRLKHAGDYQAGATIYAGDMVKLKADGTVEPSAAGAAASIGVALNYATSGNTVLVADDPDQEFVGQADDSTIDAQTDINMNYNITVGTASTLFKRSAMEVDASTQATDSNLPLKVLKIKPRIDNALGDQVDVVFKINNHQLSAGTEGV
jgi:hypothetical protein